MAQKASPALKVPVEGGAPALVLCSHKSPAAVLCAAMGVSAKETHKPVPEESQNDNQGSAQFALKK